MDKDYPTVLFTIRCCLLCFLRDSICITQQNKSKKQAENGDKKAIKALYITENFDKALTTILIGNNLTHIGFASLVTLIATQTWGLGSVKYATIFSTIVVFLLSEMIPKSYGKSNYKYALAIAGSLSALMKIFTPFSYFFTIISNFISNMFSASDEPEIMRRNFMRS